jgi:hypothetical protein
MNNPGALVITSMGSCHYGRLSQVSLAGRYGWATTARRTAGVFGSGAELDA